MSPSSDSALRRTAPPRVCALQSPRLCASCLGAGKILEPIDCDAGHVYLPVICASCGGSGHRSR